MSKPHPPSTLGLRAVDLLQSLPQQRLEEIGGQCVWRRFEPGQHLVSREDADSNVHFIVAGSVRVTSYSAGGRETSFRDLPAGTTFGELSALDGRPRSADVVALTPGLLASLPRAAFWALLRNEWSVNERVLLNVADLARRMIDRVLDLSTRSVQQRVCMELLRLARRDGTGANEARIEPVPRHAHLAHLVSSYREQVTRELSALTRAGLLAREGSALVVRDLRRLEQMAAAQPPR